MTRKLKAQAFLCAGLIALTTLSCTAPEAPLPPQASASPTTEVVGSPDAGGAAAQGKVQTATVRRGSIVETVAAIGRVGGLDEVPLMMSVASRVLSVNVEQGDSVTEGQVLLETDKSAIEREIALSRERLSEATSRYDKLQAAIQAEAQRAKETQQRTVAAQRAVAEDNQTKLRRAQDELALLQAGTPANEVLTAEGAVLSAQAALQRAEADLARAQAGPDPIEMKAAQQELTSTTIALRKAETDLQKLQSGPDPLVLSKYESDLLMAQNTLDAARKQYEAVSRGPDPLQVRLAERQVESIRIDLQSARRADVGSDKNAKMAKAASISKLELSLQTAEEQLARLTAEPDPAIAQASRRGVEVAERNVRDAIERLRVVRQGPDQVTLDGAKAYVDTARIAVERAQKRVDAIQAGATPELIDALNSNVAASQTTLLAAQARLAEVKNPRGRAMQIRDVQDRIATLQAQADNIAQITAATPADGDPAASASPEVEIPEVTAAQKAIAQEQIALQTLEKSLNETRLVAPFAGIVSAVLARPGEPVRPGRPSIVLTRGEETVVRVDVPERESSRIAAGQQASVLIENAPAKYDAIVQNIVDQGGARVGLLKVTWTGDAPALGTRVQTAIQVRRKDQVLLVPQTAIRVVGSRRYVDVVEGGGTRRVDVELGMFADGNVEIVNGLREGQQVISGS